MFDVTVLTLDNKRLMIFFLLAYALIALYLTNTLFNKNYLEQNMIGAVFNFYRC